MKQNTHNTEIDHTANIQAAALTCSSCLYCNNCDHNEPCKHFAPVDEDAYLEALMNELRTEDTSTYYDTADSTCDIDECLKDIRAGRIAYVCEKEHLAEILHIEPDIDVEYKDGVFYITL